MPVQGAFCGHLQRNPAGNFGKQHGAHLRIIPAEGRASEPGCLSTPPGVFVPSTRSFQAAQVPSNLSGVSWDERRCWIRKLGRALNGCGLWGCGQGTNRGVRSVHSPSVYCAPTMCQASGGPKILPLAS